MTSETIKIEDEVILQILNNFLNLLASFFNTLVSSLKINLKFLQKIVLGKKKRRCFYVFMACS